MQDQLIEFPTAKLAKEKGFNFKVYKQYPPDFEGVIDTDHSANCVIGGECSMKYPDKDCFAAPTQSLLQRWLREVHQIEVYVTPVIENKYITHGEYNNKNAYYQWMIWGTSFSLGDTYEQALEQGLFEALSLIK